MDRDVTVRFYELVNNDPGGPAPDEILRRVFEMRPRDRETDDPGVRLRLEHLEEDGGLLIGDMTRVQTENLPGEVTDETTDPLPVAELGHSVAFCYDPETRFVALQFDIKIGVGRFTTYLHHFGRPSDFGHMPVLSEGALERFGQEHAKKLTLRVSRVNNFRNVRQETTDFEEALERLGQLFDAPSIEITLSTRGEDNSLNRAETWNTIRRWLRLREMMPGIRTIKAETIESDEAFNFIAQLLKENDTLELPDNEPTPGRLVRMRYVRECYDKHRAYLRRIAGVG